MPKLAIPPLTKFFQPPEVGVLRWHIQTNTQMDIATLGLNQHRGQFSENHANK